MTGKNDDKSNNRSKGSTKKRGKSSNKDDQEAKRFEEESDGSDDGIDGNDDDDVVVQERPVSPSKSNASFSDEDEVPLSRLIPLVKADRRLSLENAAAASVASAAAATAAAAEVANSGTLPSTTPLVFDTIVKGTVGKESQNQMQPSSRSATPVSNPSNSNNKSNATRRGKREKQRGDATGGGGGGGGSDDSDDSSGKDDSEQAMDTNEGSCPSSKVKDNDCDGDNDIGEKDGKENAVENVEQATDADGINNEDDDADDDNVEKEAVDSADRRNTTKSEVVKSDHPLKDNEKTENYCLTEEVIQEKDEAETTTTTGASKDDATTVIDVVADDDQTILKEGGEVERSEPPKVNEGSEVNDPIKSNTENKEQVEDVKEVITMIEPVVARAEEDDITAVTTSLKKSNDGMPEDNMDIDDSITDKTTTSSAPAANVAPTETVEEIAEQQAHDSSPVEKATVSSAKLKNTESVRSSDNQAKEECNADTHADEAEVVDMEIQVESPPALETSEDKNNEINFPSKGMDKDATETVAKVASADGGNSGLLLPVKDEHDMDTCMVPAETEADVEDCNRSSGQEGVKSIVEQSIPNESTREIKNAVKTDEEVDKGNDVPLIPSEPCTEDAVQIQNNGNDGATTNESTDEVEAVTAVNLSQGVAGSPETSSVEKVESATQVQEGLLADDSIIRDNDDPIELDPIYSSTITLPTSTSKVTSFFGVDSDDDEGGQDHPHAFRRKPIDSKRKNKPKKIQINIRSLNATKLSQNSGNLIEPPLKIELSSLISESGMDLNSEQAEHELEDSLRFFQQPHEEEDPVYIMFCNNEKKEALDAALKKLEAEDELEKKEIETIVNRQLKEKQATTERSVEKYKLKIAAEEKKDMARLQQNYSEKAASNQEKINQGIQVLHKRHAAENHKVMQQHRQQLQHRRVPEQVANAELSQLSQRVRAKHQQQMQEFAEKGEEVKKKCEAEFKRDQAKLHKQSEKRLQDVDANRQSLYNRVHTGFQQLRKRYLKRHAQSIAKRREGIEKEFATDRRSSIELSTSGEKLSPYGPSKSSKEEKPELLPPSPIKTSAGWYKKSSIESSGAATRDKNRKGILSQINKQLSVEIHNEGIWLSHLSEKKDNETDKNTQKDSPDLAAGEREKKWFIPWGSKAREILHSIVCGEIPQAFDSEGFQVICDSVVQNGGHVRCVVTDLRTSDETASAQRSSAIIEREQNTIKKLEARNAELLSSIATAESSVEHIEKQEKELELKLAEIVKELERAKLQLQAFRTKYARYFGRDGKPLPTNNPGDTQKLNNAVLKLKTDVDTAQKREIASRSKIAEAKSLVQKKNSNITQGQRATASLASSIKKKKMMLHEVKSGRLDLSVADTPDKAENRVKESTALLNMTADMRREQLNQKRNSSTSSTWVQNLPGLPAPLRRSLWYKMHRRRHQIVLRPSNASMINDLKKQVKSKFISSNGTQRLSDDALEAELIRVEQLFLLATHPVALVGNSVSSIPTVSSWAEPGWHLVLDIPKENRDCLLPRASMQQLVQRNLSELCSAPGRQAASMIRTTHLRALEFPLSAVGTATSLAETNPSMAIASDVTYSNNDPFRLTKAKMELGYSFHVSQPEVAKPIIQRKRPATSKESTSSTASAPTAVAAAATTSKATKRKSPSNAQSVPTISKPHSAVVSGSAKIDSRKRKSTTQPDSGTPRALQKRKSDSSRQQLPIPEQPFQPRPIMTSQQQQPAPSPQAFNRTPVMQQQQPGIPYNQFMNTMPSPVSAQQQQQQQQRGSFHQFQNPSQMAQFRMMQQQQQQQQQQQHPPSHHHQQQQQPTQQQQQVTYGQPPQGMQQMPQFFQQMGQQQFSSQSMPIPGQVIVGQPNNMALNIQPNNPIRQSMPSADEQNDPLFMLKDM